MSLIALGVTGGIGALTLGTGSSVTFGILGLSNGPAMVRLFYRNGLAKPVAATFAIDDAPQQALPLPPSGADAWRPLDLPVDLPAGTHRLVLRGQEEGWDSVQLDHIEILPR